RERALAGAGRAGEQQRVRHAPAEHRAGRRDGGRLAARAEAVGRLRHFRPGRIRGQAAGSAFRLVVRRFGASLAAASPSTADGLALGVVRVPVRVVVRRRGADGVASAPAESAPAAGLASAGASALLARERRAGARRVPVPPAAGGAPTSPVAVHPEGLRPRRGALPFVAGAASLGAGAAVAGPLIAGSSRRGAGEGRASSWARSIASISGGTSLHGSSPEPRGAGLGTARHGRRSPRPRSPP